MRVLLTAIFLLTANGAMALGEGRYVVTSLSKTRADFILTDTKTGRFRLCENDEVDGMVRCYPWFDGIDGDEQPQNYYVSPKAPWEYIDK
jgi:hypothetical protein